DPRTVPAGRYAEESLRALGLWGRLRPKLIFAENVRQALDYVSRGEVDAGFVYVTDVTTRSGRVKEAFRPPDDTYGPIVYPGAVVVTLPLVLPPTVTGYYLIVVLGRRGWLGAPLYAATGWSIAFTWYAAVVAATVMALPLLVRTARAAIESVDRDLERAAHTLG